jgi:hypothetical protein
MGHALADHVVEGDEAPLRARRRYHSPRQPLHCLEVGPDMRSGQVGERLVVLAGNQQAVTVEQRSVIEEGERMWLVEHDDGLLLARRDAAEEAVRLRQRS